MSLYRIKPLVWEVNGHVQIANTPMYEFRIIDQLLTVTFSIRPGVPNMNRVAASSVEDAKDACRRWWEANATQFLEPAYQPSTDLPTEPGLYWWRTADAKEYDPVKPWLPVRVEDGSGGVAVIPLWGSPMKDRMMIKAWDRFHGPGHWIRIPEPEVENG